MNRRKFIQSSICLGCGASILPAAQIPFVQEYLARFSKNEFVYKRKEDLPKRVRIESCSLCQLNCTKCWLRDNEAQISKTEGFGYLKFSDFKNFVDDNPQLETIEIANNGEIFLNPELDKIVEYAHIKNVNLTADSGVNLNDISDEMAEILVKNSLKSMTVSIDGATPESYVIYRHGGDFNKVIENIKKINDYKKQYNSEFPALTWKFVLFGHNEHEIELAKQKAKELDMNIIFVPNVIHGYSPVKDIQKVYELTGVKIETEKKDIDPFTLDFLMGNKDAFIFCKQLFETPTINWNGNFLGCCCSLFENFGVNVFKQGFMNALNHHNVVYAKKMLSDFSVKPDKNVLCSECHTYHIMKKYNMPLRYKEVKNG